MKGDSCLQLICSMKESLVSALHSQISSGIQELDAKEAGEVADMIKDLAEAERNCYEAEYYKTVTEAMTEEEDPRYGYNNRRMSNGQYAPRGRGHVSGYRPYIDEEPYVYDYLHNPKFAEEMRMGYTHENFEHDMARQMNPHGKAYRNYEDARRHYSETGSSMDKDRMDATAKEHLTETVTTMRDIYHSADPELKKRIKADMSKLVSEMTV